MSEPDNSPASELRKLPSVDALLKEPDLESFIAEIGRKAVVDAVREAVD